LITIVTLQKVILSFIKMVIVNYTRSLEEPLESQVQGTSLFTSSERYMLGGDSRKFMTNVGSPF